MLDQFLPDYLLTVSTIRNANRVERASQIVTLSGSRIYRQRAPQGTTYPYIIVGDGHDIDVGQTADFDLLREVGMYNVLVCGLTMDSIDQLYRDVLDAIKMVRNQYIPSNVATPKLWVQCLIVKDTEEFTGKPVDGGQENYVGYYITVKGAYDP